MLRALPDNSLMVAASERPLVLYAALGRILAIAAIYNAVRQWQSGRLHTRPVSPQVAPISPHRRRRVDSRDSAARTP